MIKFQQVSKAYRGGRQALQKVDFHLRRGEMAFLGGHSGAGKSTLLKLICAIERPTDGKIHFNGHDITRISNKDIPFLRRNIGIVFQDHRLLMDRSVFDNVALPMRIESISENEIKRRVSAALDKTGLLDKARCLPSQLSGGEQQRVGNNLLCKKTRRCAIGRRPGAGNGRTARRKTRWEGRADVGIGAPAPSL